MVWADFGREAVPGGTSSLSPVPWAATLQVGVSAAGAAPLPKSVKPSDFTLCGRGTNYFSQGF